MTFLPEGYKLPDNSDYMKLKDGENTFRVLSPAVVGFEYWNTQNKSVRSKVPFKGVPADIRYEDGKPDRVKHFWAFVVWNVEAEKVQILQLTQQSIMDAIKALVDNKKWGDPKGYDITITRSGSGFDTEYQTMPNPHTPVPAEATEALAARPVYLDALFMGGNPFKGAPEVRRDEGEVAAHEEPQN